jgi:hypothetical protein
VRKPAFYRVCAAAAMLWLLSSCAPQPRTLVSGPVSERLPEKSGWIQVRLAGTPREIGFQHGSLLTGEILDAKKAIQLLLQHDTQKGWDFYRTAAREMLWPKIEEEYRQELQGIADGVKSKGFEVDVWDITAMNAWMELGWYYVPEYDKRHGIKTAATLQAPEHCSAFVATGSYTADGKVVVAHNAWVDYVVGERWNIVFEIAPEHGNRIFMDGFPGLIHSADDFAMNSAGLIVTETTIGSFHGFDPSGVPEFVRARKAVQYAANIDQFDRIMRKGNNGGLANNWLVADRNTGEIASLELGLKNVTLQRKKDGFFAGSNLPESQKLIQEETDFKPSPGDSSAARHARWLQLFEENKGKIDVALAQQFLADDFDVILKKRQPSERTLCGRIDLSPRGLPTWQKPYGPAGAVQNKATDASMAAQMGFVAAYGPQCGPEFRADEFTAKHPEFAWQNPSLRDMPSKPWATFQAAR